MRRINSEEEIEQALKQAISAITERDAINALTPLAGVGVKMASAIMTSIKPKTHTVLDFRALDALGIKDGNTVELYVEYLEACRSIAKKHGVTLRDLDRANWQWSKNKSKRDKACCCDVAQRVSDEKSQHAAEL